MTQKELEKYSELNEKFRSDCTRVAEILSDLKEPKQYDGCDITYADNFYLCGEDVSWNGDEYWSYGGHEYHSGYFPKEYLTMTDDELRAIVEKENKKYAEEQEAKKKAKEEEKKAERLRQYEELKKEFGNDTGR